MAEYTGENEPARALGKLTGLGQGIYFIVTGIWPIVSPGSFQAVTGPRTDMWLVKTMGALITVTGGVILTAGVRERITGEIVGLAAGSSAALMGSDLIFASKGRISKIYMLEAAAEVGLIALWGVWLALRGRKG